jgi:SAM-dependent methyltransferase
MSATKQTITEQKTDDAFINPTFDFKSLDRATIRKFILDYITSALPEMNGNLLDIGCGKMPYRKLILQGSAVETYTGLDIETAIVYDKEVKPDFFWDGQKMPFDNSSFDCALATEVLEHVPHPNIFLSEAHRVLKSNGKLFFTVPFLWNLHEVPYDEYRYTPFSLERILKENGFTDIHIQATGGWHASMAMMIGLWIKRSPMALSKKKILAFILTPAMKYLLKKDKQTKISFTEGQMITGLCGYAIKP